VSRAAHAPGLAALAVGGLLGLGLGAPARAAAYEEGLHQLLGERALPGDLPRDLVRPGPAEAAALRRAAWQAGAAHPDADVRRRFLARHPDVAGFDDWAWKDLLGLSPDAAVVGIDAFPDLGGDARTVAARAARAPDEDGRNRERFARAPDRSVRTDAWGRPLPADPAQLDMGSLRGISSQAYAHYGLPRLERSDAPEVLKADPRRFAWPPAAQAFAADFAQVHADLALAAAGLGSPGGDALAWVHLGASHHYLADVANQIHTLQAVFPFFVDAKVQHWKVELLSAGGLLGSRPGFVDIGIGIVQNHHLFLENLWAKRLREAVAGRPAHPRVAEGLAAIGAGAPDLERALDARGLDPAGPFGRAIAEELMELSSREGAEVYEAARHIARPRLSRARYEMADGTDPDLEVRPSPDPDRLDRFYALQGAGLARAGSALRRETALFRQALAASASPGAREALRDAALRRLVAERLGALDAREARLAAWTPGPPASETVSWGPAAGAVLALALAAYALALAARAVLGRARRGR
jgi:hypothetical protein